MFPLVFTSRPSLLDKSLEHLVDYLVHQLPAEHHHSLEVTPREDRAGVAAEDGERREGHVGEQLGQDVVLDELDMSD